MNSPATLRRVVAACLILICGLLAAAATSNWQSSAEDPLIVTSSLGSTSAILFLVDPANRTLSAYEAIPGGEGGLRWLGARKIDHDLKLTKYRDLSEFSYTDLKARYQSQQVQEEDR